MAKKFSDDELDEVLSRIEKFNADGIRYIHLKDGVKKHFVKTKIPEFKLKDILVFLDENGLVQRILFDDKPGFHDLTLYRISEKRRDLISKFSREPGEVGAKIAILQILFAKTADILLRCRLPILNQSKCGQNPKDAQTVRTKAPLSQN